LRRRGDRARPTHRGHPLRGADRHDSRQHRRRARATPRPRGARLMDTKNRFHTAQTFWWVRLEHVAVIAVGVLLLLQHAAEVRWGRFAFAFVLIDLVGYVPGAVAWR